MRHILALTLLTACVLQAGAQVPGTKMIYLNENWKRVEGAVGATYYRIVVPTPDGKFNVKDYYMSGQLQMETTCTAYDPKLIWEGMTKLYHENGTVSEEGPFKDEERYGLHHYWYDNGARHKDVFFREKEKIYHNYWSRSGQSFLSGGNGIVTDQTKDFTYYMEIEDSVHVGTFTIEDADTVYMMVQQKPEYEGGDQQMTRTILRTMRYPPSARRLGIEGTVYVQFIIDKNGNIKNCKIKRGIGAECDEEALRAVSSLKRWNPGRHKGKTVQVRFMLPLQFKLS